MFDKGVRELASERHERREIGTATEVNANDVIRAAERLACYLVLSGKEIVDLGDSPPPRHLGRRDVEGLNDGQPPLDYDMLRTIGSSGLCESDLPGCFCFAHRLLAEYLAGRRIGRLPLHQARSLLGHPSGWQKGVAGPLGETAAFAAMQNADIARWIAKHDPEVVGISDVADRDLRRQALLALFEQFRRHELTDVQFDWGEMELHGLNYDGVETDLRAVLAERGEASRDAIKFSVQLIRCWELCSMSADLAQLMLDRTAPLGIRTTAGYALHDIGTPEATALVKPLIDGDPDDEHRELKGLALAAVGMPKR